MAVTSTATNALGFRTCDYAGTDAGQLTISTLRHWTRPRSAFPFT
ncbi:hypothetical protein ACNKHT_10500 [Shigella flexneri]